MRTGAGCRCRSYPATRVAGRARVENAISNKGALIDDADFRMPRAVILVAGRAEMLPNGSVRCAATRGIRVEDFSVRGAATVKRYIVAPGCRALLDINARNKRSAGRGGRCGGLARAVAGSALERPRRGLRLREQAAGGTVSLHPGDALRNRLAAKHCWWK